MRRPYNPMSMARWRCKLSLFVLLLSAGPAVAADWVVYSSNNFAIYSDQKEDEILLAIGKFESFREVVLQLLQIPDTRENERLKIIVLNRRSDFTRIAGVANVAGFFYHGVFGPRMIVGPEAFGDAQPVLFHEYVHYLMNRHSNVNYPRWYSEGLAELLETAEFSRSSVALGRPTDTFLVVSQVIAALDTSSYFRPLPLRQLIDFEPDESASEFYATAWLLVHYLLIDSVDDPDRIDQTTDYLLRLDAGEDPQEAFGASFGISTGEMDGRLESYSRSLRFKTFAFPYMPHNGEVSRTVLGEDEVLYLLGDIAVERNRHDAAHYFFDRLEEQSTGSPLAGKAGAQRAVAYIHEERIAEGDALVAELIALNSDDPEILSAIAHYSFDRLVHARTNSGPAIDSYLEQAIDFGGRAVAADPRNIEALYYLGRAQEENGDFLLAATTFAQAILVSPTVSSVNLAMAHALVEANQPDAAAVFISRVYSAVHSEELRARLRDVQRRLDDKQFVLTTLEELQ